MSNRPDYERSFWGEVFEGLFVPFFILAFLPGFFCLMAYLQHTAVQ